MLQGAHVKIFIFLLILVSLVSCNTSNADLESKQLFDLNWKFNFGNNQFASEVDFSDQNWRNLDLPHDWKVDDKLTSLMNLEGKGSLDPETGWYRKHFMIPESWENKNIFIAFEGISEDHDIYINGQHLNESYFSKKGSFQELISPYLNYRENNLIAIRISNENQKSGRLKTDAGIFRHVWLIVENSQNEL